MNRSQRARMAQQTVDIVERGRYESNDGVAVDIASDVAAALTAARLYTPDQLDAIAAECRAAPAPFGQQTDILVANETTLQAARRLVVDQHHAATMCLNFASAKNAGGGFLGGSQAQEESLARSSALHATQLRQGGYYEANRRCYTALYTDHMILSPDVPVIRDDDGTLLSSPYRLSILTAPAVNAGAVRKNQPDEQHRIRPTMARRIGNVLAVAADRGYTHLVLGAWGCGVFRNSPAEIAELFAAALSGPFGGRFQSVVFAVLDGTDDERIVTPFRTTFGVDNDDQA